METFEELFNKIGIELKVFYEHHEIFKEAFTHRSAVNEKTKLKSHNERMEFLGDAVLELSATDFLFKHFPERPEGELTSLRSALVKKENLAKVARKLEIGTLLRMSKGEARSGGRNKDYLLANLIEAFIGALYISAGYEVADKFIQQFVLDEIDHILKDNLHIDAKSQFQEFTQGHFGITPRYEVISDEGKDHEKVFELGAFLNQTEVGRGKGHSKKQAQVEAASDALKNQKKWESEFPPKGTT